MDGTTQMPITVNEDNDNKIFGDLKKKKKMDENGNLIEESVDTSGKLQYFTE